MAGTKAGSQTLLLIQIDLIGGSNYIHVSSGSFQVSNRATGNTTDGMYLALQAAQLAPTGYEATYNWLIDTSQFASSTVTPTFAQIGLFVNGGDGFYAQDFGATKEVQLSGAQLSSGQVFTGQATVILGNDAAGGSLVPPVTQPETFSHWV